jgi:aminoglycoside phosphotransferase (APT) family kinase protein
MTEQIQGGSAVRLTHDEEVTGLSSWLTEVLGCTDIDLHRQRRWRPIWHAKATQNGVRREMMLKGERTWPTHPYSLEYEARMQQALYENGIPIPAILGFCPEPKTIAMEWIQGGRDPGLMQEAIENASSISPDRWQASLRYMEILADMHRIPPEKFVAAGAVMPTNAQELGLASFERFHAMTRTFNLTNPLIEFCAGWLRRNYPKNRSQVSFLTGDCGQFMSDGPEVTCIMDVEIGHLGDNMRDLACYRGRHPIENMGDIPALYRHYEQAFGAPLDYQAIAFHTVTFMLEAYYGPLFCLHETRSGGDWVEAVVQVGVIGRRCMEAIAEIIGLELEAFDLPEPEATSLEDMALDKLIADIGRVPTSEALQDWQRGIIGAIPAYLRTRLHYRNWAERGDLADIAELTGVRTDSRPEADAALLAFIAQAGPDQDAALTRLLYRQTMRQCLIIAGPNPAPGHIAFARMEPILHLDPKSAG